MSESASVRQFDQRLVDGYYVDAIVLADEARAFFDQKGDECRAALDRLARLDFACESLKVTTRIMHAIAWLLTQRAIFAGELPESARLDPRYKLGEAATTNAGIANAFSAEMASLIMTSEDLFERIARFEQQLVERAGQIEYAPPSPARDLLSRLEQSL